jgi:predicted acylesterase/phospholipase RssA
MKAFQILTLSGGGTKGFLHIGALHEIERHVGNLTSHFKKGVYGCSVGSLFATGIAFGLNASQLERLSKNFLDFEHVYQPLSISFLGSSLTKKGMFEMDKFEEVVLKAFDSENVNLRGKYISDAQIPLSIVASNLTKGVPSIFRQRVPVLTAIRASSCVPIVFRPQIINENVYIDGGYFTNELRKLLPKEQQDTALSMNIVHVNPSITPSNLEQISIPDYLYKLYKLSCLYEHANYTHPNIINMYHNRGAGVGTIANKDKDEMILSGRVFMRSFLAKRPN